MAEVIEGEVVHENALTPVASSAIEQLTRGEIDMQIATAKRYPRSVDKFKKEAESLATVDAETADSCIYALPRAGEEIEGPSVRLAEILASSWGHIRVDGKIIDVGQEFVTARGLCWDLERNVAIAVEVKRRITTKDNKRYGADMIMVASNAAISIATRNAILKVIPQGYWQGVYAKCRKVVEGSAETMTKRRDEMLKYFKGLGVTPEQVCKVLDIKGIDDINLDHLVKLRGAASAIKSGEATVDGIFGDHSESQDTSAEWVEKLSPADKQAVVAALNASKLTRGQKTTFLKKYEGKPQELLAELAKKKQEPVASTEAKMASETPVEEKKPEKKVEKKPAAEVEDI